LENDPWTSREILGLIVATGVFSSFATFVFSGFADAVKDRLRRTRAARYAGIRCAVILEKYAVDCWDTLMMSEGEFDTTRDMSPQPLPSPPSFPEDIDWSTLDPSLAVEVLSFTNGSSIAQSHVEYARMWENNPFEFQGAARDRGLRALTLAGRLRKRYELDPSNELDRLWKDFKGKK